MSHEDADAEQDSFCRDYHLRWRGTPLDYRPNFANHASQPVVRSLRDRTTVARWPPTARPGEFLAGGEQFDYGDKRGVAIESIYGVGKMQFGSNASSDTGDLKDHGA